MKKIIFTLSLIAFLSVNVNAQEEPAVKKVVKTETENMASAKKTTPKEDKKSCSSAVNGIIGEKKGGCCAAKKV